MDKLERPFGIWTATAMVVGGMIGAGIFVLPAALAPFGWTGVASWLVAGTGTIAIASIIAAFAVGRPEEPSILTTCGDILGLLPGRLLSWAYWISTVASFPVFAMTAAAYLLHLAPGLPQGTWATAILGTAIMAALTATNLFGVREAGRVQVATVVLKLLPLILVIGIVAWLALTAPRTYTQTEAASFSFAQLTPALTITFFAMLGFECASLVSERVRDPARDVFRATLFGLVAVLVIYLIVSTGIVLAVPVDELHASSAPIAVFVARYLGSWASDAVALFAAISAIGCLNGFILLSGELPLGLVRDGQLPEAIAPINRNAVAARPLLLGAGLGVALMLGSVTAMGEEVLDFLLRLTTAAMIWFYAGVCIAALRTRTRRPLAIVGFLFCLWAFYGSGWEAGGLSVLLLAAGVPLHFLVGGRTHAPLAAESA